MVKKTHYEFINVLRFFAVILVLNSHYEMLYPNPVFATGGALGNSLFFISSGFVLVNVKEKFHRWYLKRLSRIFIPVWIAIFAGFIVNNKVPSGLINWIKTLIWPTQFWFIGALVLFYPLYYVVLKNNFLKHFSKILISLIVLYFAYYIFLLDTSKWVVEASGLVTISGLFKLIYYFTIMLLGAYFRLSKKEFTKQKPSFFLALSVLSVLAMYASKFLMDKFEVIMHFQFFNQLCTTAFACFLIIACIKGESTIKLLLTHKWYKIISFVSSITLECYLTQFLVIGFISGFNIVFPLNIVLATLAVFACAKSLKFVTDYIFKSKSITRSVGI